MLLACLEGLGRALADRTPATLGPCPEMVGKNNVGKIYSNLDHEFTAENVARVSRGGCHGKHYAWNFCGTVWFDGKEWCEDVMRYGDHVELITGPSVEHVVAEANKKYGDD
jgi:hypothetical protein